MSYILEALKKSDAERKRGEAPTLGPVSPFSPALRPHTPNPVPWILTGGLAIALLVLANVIYFRPEMLQFANASKPTPPRLERSDQEPVQKMADAAPLPEATPAPMPMPKHEPVPEPVPEAISAPEPQPEAEPEAVSEPEVASITVHKPSPAPVLAETRPAETRPESASQAPTQAPDQIEDKRQENSRSDASETSVKATPSKPSLIVVPQAPPPPKPQIDAAKVFVDKAWSSIDKGFYNQALRDLDQAVVIEPNLADAWFARGWANEKSGKELSAIGDYARAISAKPDHAFALFSRGYLNLYIGDARHAVTDFVRTQGVAKDRSLRLYSHLWLYLSRTRAQQDALAALNDDVAKEDLTPWPGPLVRHILGQVDEKVVLTAIENDQGTPDKQERRCTGYFFLGVKALLRDDKTSARSFFEKALATGAVQFRQYDAAKRELDRLNL